MEKHEHKWMPYQTRFEYAGGQSLRAERSVVETFICMECGSVEEVQRHEKE